MMKRRVGISASIDTRVVLIGKGLRIRRPGRQTITPSPAKVTSIIGCLIIGMNFIKGVDNPLLLWYSMAMEETI
jgi:hypothetical protein